MDKPTYNASYNASYNSTRLWANGQRPSWAEGLCASSVLLALFLTCVSGAACAVQVVGVELPERVRLGGNGPELILNGAGVRVAAFFKIYVSALYLTTRNSDGEAILSEDQPRRLTLFFLRKVSSEQLATSTDSAIRNTLTPAERQPLNERLSQFNAMLGSLSDLRKGTEIVIDYTPKAGTTIRVDGKGSQHIPGADFNRALMRIWLGERPNDPELKKAMLGAF